MAKKINTEAKAKAPSYFTSRKFKYGSVATGLTVAFVAVVVILNVIFSLLADAYSWKVDMTSYGLYSLDNEIIEAVNALNTDIEVTVIYAEDQYPEEFKEPIKRICNLSDRLKLTFVDPEVNPQVMNSFGTEYEITEGATVVKNGKRIRVIEFSDLYEQSSTTGAITYKIEGALSSALYYVTKPEIPLVYFVTGHNESGYTDLMSTIANNGADTEEVRLTQLTEFDEMAEVMVICGPTGDFSEAEIRVIEDFLANDYNYERNLMYFANPTAPALPNLDAFLEEWGIKVNKDIVLEADTYNSTVWANTFYGNATAAPLFIYASYTDAEVSGDLLKAETSTVVPYSQSINLLFEQYETVATKALLTSSGESYAKGNTGEFNTYEKVDGDQTGPFNLAVIATKSRMQNNVEIESHVFVAGSVDIIYSSFLDYEGNGAFLQNVYQMMVDESEAHTITGEKQANSTRMSLSTATVRNATIFFVGVIPGIFLIIGIVVYIRRRYL